MRVEHLTITFMQYARKEIGERTLVKIKWHGEPTRVRINGQHEKVEVPTGGVIEVEVEQARQLISMYRQFTLEGDELMKQPKTPAAPSAKEKEEAKKSGLLSLEDIEKLEKKADVVAALKARGIKHNATGASVKELKDLLIEAVKEETKEPEENKPEDGKGPEGSAPEATGDAQGAKPEEKK